MSTPTITSVSKSPTHTFSKEKFESIKLLEGLGVEGDAHMGKTVKHVYQVKKDPTKPNLRQVHLIQSELFEELAEKGYQVSAGQLGENITTSGVDLLNLPKGTILRLGDEAEVEITGLRSPCKQIDGLQKGLMKAVLDKDEEGNIIRKSGVMGIVLKSGQVNVGDPLEIHLPDGVQIPLEVV